MASLSRSGTGFAIGDRRSDGAWGQVRAQQSGGDPKLRYCASLGHRADDESGLIYMRARYYEPASGRFISEDAAKAGRNWFGYCNNNPIRSVDPKGTDPVDVIHVGRDPTFGERLMDMFGAVENGSMDLGDVAD